MDLSSSHFDRAAELAVWPGDLAVLMIGTTVRQGTSRTATMQAELGTPAAAVPHAKIVEPQSFTPVDGAFHGGVAASLAGWAGATKETGG